MVVQHRTSKALNKVSLQRALSKLGYCSRSQALGIIKSGTVVVNGTLSTNPHRWVDLQNDRIEINGTVLRREEFRYVLFHKPEGVVTTSRDELGRKTIYDILPSALASLKPVGRLDKDTSGMLLMTNDNRFANIVTSPQSHISKMYEVVVEHPLTHNQQELLKKGIEIDVRGQRYTAKGLSVFVKMPTVIHISIDEGKNRQIRRMFAAVGSKVKKLKRIAIGSLTLGTLRAGEYRELTSEEIQLLLQKQV